MNSKLSLIAVIGRNRELGKDSHLLWNLPEDLKRFRLITKGHPVIMGRKTFQSIGRPLPDRVNIVITRDPSKFTQEGATAVRSLEEAIAQAKQAPGSEEVFVIGGGSIYAQAIGRAERLYLTVVDATAPADTFFPDYRRFSRVISKEDGKEGNYRYSYLVLEPK